MPYKDPVKAKEQREKYYQEHRGEIILQKQKHYQDNKEEINKKKRSDYQDPGIREKQQITNRNSRLKNRDEILKKDRTPKRRFQFLVSYAKRRELSCLLTEEQYTELINKPCDYCDNQLASSTDSTGVGLDRLDNSKGYELDNIVPCCVICNRTRNDHFTPEETKIAIGAVIRHRNNKSER